MSGRKGRSSSAAQSPPPRPASRTAPKRRVSTLTVASDSAEFASPTPYDEKSLQRSPRHVVFSNVERNSCFLSVLLQGVLRVRPLVGFLLTSGASYSLRKQSLVRRFEAFAPKLSAKGPDGLGRLGRGGRTTRADQKAPRSSLLWETVLVTSAMWSVGDKERASKERAAERNGVLLDKADCQNLKITPSTFFYTLMRTCPNFGVGNQEDVAEATTFFLDTVHREMLADQVSDKGPSTDISLEQAGADHTTETPVSKLFRGVQRTSVRCKCCDKVSPRDEPQWIMSVPIPDNHMTDESATVDECIRSHFADESLEGDDRYFCEACGCKCDACKATSLSVVPEVAILQLKRNQDPNDKVETHVELPLELDLDAYAAKSGSAAASSSDMHIDAGDGKRGAHKLTAVVVHKGSSAVQGHYAVYSLVQDDGDSKEKAPTGPCRPRWCLYDDSRPVAEFTDDDFVLSQQAYMAYYSRDGVPSMVLPPRPPPPPQHDTPSPSQQEGSEPSEDTGLGAGRRRSTRQRQVRKRSPSPPSIDTDDESVIKNDSSGASAENGGRSKRRRKAAANAADGEVATVDVEVDADVVMAPRRAAGETAAARARTERLRRRSLLVGKVCESIDTGDAGSNRESEAAAPAAPALVKPPPILPILPPSRPLATNSNEATNISGRTRQAAKSGAGADGGRPRPPLHFSQHHQYGLGQPAGGSFGAFGSGPDLGVSASAYQPMLSSPCAYASFGQPAFVQPQPRRMAPSYRASSSKQKQPPTVQANANANGVSATTPAAASSSSACPGYRPFFPPLQLPPSNPHTRHTGIGGNKPQIATSTMVATSAAAAAAASSAVDCQWQQAKGDLSGKGLARPTSRGGGSGVAMGEASKAHAVGGTVGDGTRTRSGYRNDVPASLFGGYAPIMPRAGIPNPGPVTRASHIRYAQQLPNGYPYQLRQHPQAVTLWGQWPAGAATAREVPVAHPHSHPNPHPQHHHPQPFPAIAQVLPQATASVMGGGGGIAESAMQRLLMAQMYPQHHLNTRHR